MSAACARRTTAQAAVDSWTWTAPTRPAARTRTVGRDVAAEGVFELPDHLPRRRYLQEPSLHAGADEGVAVGEALLTGADGVDTDRIGILGHCWGGRVAWLGACRMSGFKAAAVMYGGRVKVGMGEGAETAISLAGNITCPVLGIFGNDDKNPTPEDVDDYEAALQEAGVDYRFHRYDGAGHGFQDFCDKDRYRADASDDAWTKQLAFFEAHLM